MATPTTRLLRLLSLFQARREWSGEDLSERLEVDVRTVRRSVERLRELGYGIESSGGVGGGYRMGAGTMTPPLLLSDEEVAAVVLSLGATAGSVANLRETALAVLVKLDRIVPHRLRSRVRALEAATMTLPMRRASVDWKILTAIAGACHGKELLEFRYQDRTGKPTRRCVEPMHLVHTGHLWYLVAWDRERQDFRTFRLDRVESSGLVRREVFVPKELPEELATFVARSLASGRSEVHARLHLRGAASEVASRLPPWLGTLEAAGPTEALLTMGAGSLEQLASLFLLVDVPILRLEPPELAEELEGVFRRAQSKLQLDATPAGRSASGEVTRKGGAGSRRSPSPRRTLR